MFGISICGNNSLMTNLGTRRSKDLLQGETPLRVGRRLVGDPEAPYGGVPGKNICAMLLISNDYGQDIKLADTLKSWCGGVDLHVLYLSKVNLAHYNCCYFGNQS